MLRQLYYFTKPIIPRRMQIGVRRGIASLKRHKYSGTWPIDLKANERPESWHGWPDGKQFAFVLTHDVETARGQEKCCRLMECEASLGFKSSFYFIPERYDVSEELLDHLKKNGFEIGLHGLNHDGKLYNSRTLFQSRAEKMNRYLQKWQSVGFRSPAMHHNLYWIHDLHIEYDLSTFDTDPFEPQSDGVGTIFPYWVRNGSVSRGYVEMPYTLPQDFTLFIILKEKNTDIWKKKLDWIAENGGMALMTTHPDYMHFNGRRMSPEEYPCQLYENFLEYVKRTFEGSYWHALPRDVSMFMKQS